MFLWINAVSDADILSQIIPVQNKYIVYICTTIDLKRGGEWAQIAVGVSAWQPACCQ